MYLVGDMSTDKPWVKNYPEGTPDQLEFDPKTLVTVLDDAESEYPESLALLILAHPSPLKRLKSNPNNLPLICKRIWA